MNGEPNPYESPHSVAAVPVSHSSSVILRAVGRIVVMGLTGFISFLAVALLYLVLAESFELEIFPSLGWALETAGIGAAIFLGSELFNVGQDRITRFVFRIATACGIFVASGFLSSILVGLLGWQQRGRYEENPDWLQIYVLWIVVYFGVMVTARMLYGAASHHQLQKPNVDHKSLGPAKF